MNPREQRLANELSEQRDARQIAEENLARYREAFAWLLKQKWFVDNHAKLRKYLKEKNEK